MAGFYTCPVPLCPLVGLHQLLHAKDDEKSKAIRYILARMPKFFYALQSIVNDLQCILVCPRSSEEDIQEDCSDGNYTQTSVVNVVEQPPCYSYNRTETTQRGNCPPVVKNESYGCPNLGNASEINNSNNGRRSNCPPNNGGSYGGSPGSTNYNGGRNGQRMGGCCGGGSQQRPQGRPSCPPNASMQYGGGSMAVTPQRRGGSCPTMDQTDTHPGIEGFAEYVKNILYERGLKSFVEMMEGMDRSDIESLLNEFFERRRASY